MEAELEGEKKRQQVWVRPLSFLGELGTGYTPMEGLCGGDGGRDAGVGDPEREGGRGAEDFLGLDKPWRSLVKGLGDLVRDCSRRSRECGVVRGSVCLRSGEAIGDVISRTSCMCVGGGIEVPSGRLCLRSFLWWWS